MSGVPAIVSHASGYGDRDVVPGFNRLPLPPLAGPNPPGRDRFSAPEGAERRRWRRDLPGDTRAHIIPRVAGYSWTVKVADLSRGGIRLLLTHKINVDSLVLVKIYNRAHKVWV